MWKRKQQGLWLRQTWIRQNIGMPDRNIKPCVINVYVWHELWQQYEAFCICYKKLLLINNRIFHFVTCDMAFMSPKMSATINKNHTHDDKLHLPTAVNVGHFVITPFLANQLQKWWTIGLYCGGRFCRDAGHHVVW